MSLRTLGQHAGCPGYPGTAQQIEQNRFRLIVAMVRQRQPIRFAAGECGMTHAARGSFQALAAISGHLNSNNAQRHIVTLAEIGAEPGPGVGVRADPMMHMHGGKREGNGRG
jgi:hypothetical protein